jgi:hypothetical protein
VLAEVERQQRREHVEGEKQRKVGRHHLAVIPIPESLHLPNLLTFQAAKVRFFDRNRAKLTLTNYKQT